MKLHRGLRGRVLLVAVAVGLTGALAGTAGSLVVHARATQLLFQRNWETHGRAEMMPACEQAEGDWSWVEADGVHYYPYDLRDRTSRVAGAPPLEPELVARFHREDGPPIRLLWEGPWGGEALLPGTHEGPCSVVLVRWPARPEVQNLAALSAGAGLATTLMATLALVGFFVVRPLHRRVRELRRAAEAVGREEYTAADLAPDDDLGAIARSIDRAHLRVREDRENILGHRTAMERFLSDVAHDLRTPITSLQLGVEALSAQQLDPEGQEALRGAFGDVVYIASLTRNLQLATRLADGWDPFAGNPWSDLADTVRRVETRERIFARHRGVTLDVSVGKGPALVRGDATMVEQALSNLVQNAITYGDEGGRVAITLEIDDQRFTLRVEDDGPGVPAEALPRLGDRTFRADQARRRDPKGSGLGLAIVREIVERADWEMRFEPRQPRGLVVSIVGRCIRR